MVDDDDDDDDDEERMLMMNNSKSATAAELPRIECLCLAAPIIRPTHVFIVLPLTICGLKAYLFPKKF